jgi:hypothetical protein
MELNYEYPTTTELREINPEKIQEMTMNDPVFDIFPIVDSEFWTLEWKQKDNWRGMQQLRGLNGEPSYVKFVGEKTYSAQPGVYGEYSTVDEHMMTLRAQSARGDDPIDISDLVIERQDYLNFREIVLLKYIYWKCLLDGEFLFTGPNGAQYGDKFPIQTATFSDWSDLDNATPIADLINLKLSTTGKSVSFGSGALMFMNSRTVSYLLLNRNEDDLGGQLAVGATTKKNIKTLIEVNTLLTSHGLPTIVEYNDGYHRESDGAFQLWIPDDKISIIGQRTNGDKLGEYRMVKNAQNPNGEPGRYEKVIDHLDTRVPRTIEVHRGHNGGLVVFYGSAIVRASC